MRLYCNDGEKYTSCSNRCPLCNFSQTCMNDCSVQKICTKNVHDFLFMHSLTPPFRVIHLFSISHVYIMDLPVSVLLSILRFSFPVQFHAELLLRAVVSRHHPAKQRKLYVIILRNKESFTSPSCETKKASRQSLHKGLHLKTSRGLTHFIPMSKIFSGLTHLLPNVQYTTWSNALYP